MHRPAKLACTETDNGLNTGSQPTSIRGDLAGALEALLLASQQESARRKRELDHKRTALEQKIAALRSDYEAESVELHRIDEQVGTRAIVLTTAQTASGLLRRADVKGLRTSNKDVK